MTLTPQEVTYLVAHVSGTDPYLINRITRFEEDLHMDSADMWYLAAMIEDAMGFYILDEVMTQIWTVGELADMLGGGLDINSVI